MDDEKNEDWRNEVPESEQLGDSSRISDSHWEDLVNQIAEPSAMMGDMPADEVRERLEEDEGWEPGPAAPIGWRTASPTLMLSVVATFGAVLLLLLGVIFFRPLPGWFLLVGIAVGLGGAVGLFFHLPTNRSSDGDNGASV
ncbi:MAG: hypothetical protein ACTMKZ_11435 [Brevibacterium aurantiacum]|uniref:Uncharacterized protein n=1 Tax=Brevibacterium aurantiacum TaxID=273384 RepID=A0A1D7W3Q6_BREAU|nr:hypothetical protein [Brevibacterium aurantiacum]MDN5593269.1 hypothetical protein [Brevibacterium sp.]AOP53697.1 hypothetical protein BLSMQ_1987 [Brevibacterium aurantiacum]AZL05867.1 hypothetical protein CXR24_09950 [Brevibacterium aurantiacum]AZL09430.1 hypothetical protein CXR26_09490 [Brevibacterium aurantiacum]AZT93551.1 hypothetical protein CXR23_10715 [Brevibacterium aurantiacum]